MKTVLGWILTHTRKTDRSKIHRMVKQTKVYERGGGGKSR